MPEEETKADTSKRVKVIKTDMEETMLAKLSEIVVEVFDQQREKATGNKEIIYKDIATGVKQAFDSHYPPVDNKATSGVYHCVVGTNFACSVTHETHFSCYLSCDNVSLLIYKSKDSPFD
mmetsp:Transcript_24739/g.50168  ORF Transcript_24739/g.50168 Transcript_24739/m.50168 type:complete len:120 (+) Transcript_24739:76-435(+)